MGTVLLLEAVGLSQHQTKEMMLHTPVRHSLEVVSGEGFVQLLASNVPSSLALVVHVDVLAVGVHATGLGYDSNGERSSHFRLL